MRPQQRNLAWLLKNKKGICCFPPFAEQAEIARLLETAIRNYESAKTAAESVLKRIDLMKKKILGPAFRGKLGTNNPQEVCEAPEA